MSRRMTCSRVEVLQWRKLRDVVRFIKEGFHQQYYILKMLYLSKGERQGHFQFTWLVFVLSPAPPTPSPLTFSLPFQSKNKLAQRFKSGSLLILLLFCFRSSCSIYKPRRQMLLVVFIRVYSLYIKHGISQCFTLYV